MICLTQNDTLGNIMVLSWKEFYNFGTPIQISPANPLRHIWFSYVFRCLETLPNCYKSTQNQQEDIHFAYIIYQHGKTNTVQLH